MDKIDFSIVFNSRSRVPMLTRMLECIQDTTYDLNALEVIVNFDDDDEDSLSHLHLLEKRFRFLKCIVNKRELNIHVNVNKMAFMAKGDYIWALGDDCHIITKHWDLIAKTKFEYFALQYPDNIFLGAVDSTSIDRVLEYGWYCDAPILTKQGRDGLGYLIHPHFISVGADVATWKIYSSVGRIIDMREICFDHVTHNSIDSLSKKDKTQIEYLQRQFVHANQVFNPFTYDYSQDIEKIKGITVEKSFNSI